MRLFVGIPIPLDVEARMRALVDALRPLAAVKWCRVAGLHLTLKFIGEQDPSRLSSIQGALRALGERAPFELVLRGVGWFPNARAPHVFWAGVERQIELTRLAADTDRVLAAIEIPPEQRAYAPHVTLARIPKGAHIGRLREHLSAARVPDFGAFTVDHFTLYESRQVLAAGGRPTREHHAIETFPFHAARDHEPGR